MQIKILAEDWVGLCSHQICENLLKKLIILQKINFTVNNNRQSDYRVAISHIKVTIDKGLDMEIMALFYLRNNCTLCFVNNL